MRKFLSLSILFMLFLGWACTEDETETTILITEEVLYASGENVRLLGRLITNQSISVSDHGFYISEEESFSSPLIISLGLKDSPGRFIGETNGLTNSKTYFVKAFMELGGEIQFGNVIELNTLSPLIETFSPAFGLVGGEMVILGQNFTEDTKVFFGDSEATVTSIDFESRLNVIIPEASDVTVPIRVIVQDKLLEFTSLFEYRIGTYELINKYPESVRLYGNDFFPTNLGFVVGLGTISKNNFYSKYQQYDIGSNSWNEITFPGSPRAYGFSTSNFLGGGVSELVPDPFDINFSFYKINGNSFERLSDLPFASRESIAFESGGSLFVLGGKEGNTFAFRKYNSASKMWTELPDSPKSFSIENAFFLYQDRLFVIDIDSTLWEYTISSNMWTTISTYPGGLGQGYGMGHVIGNKAYIGLYQRNSEIWELDLNSMIWKSKNNIPGLAQEITVAHFEKDGFLYIMRMPDITVAGSFPMNLYKFDPNGF